VIPAASLGTWTRHLPAAILISLNPFQLFTPISLTMCLYAFTFLCMRTTLDIDDQLAIEAKKAAVEKRTSLKALVETGLRWVLHGKGGMPKDPLDALAGLGKDVWQGVNPDRYVRECRRGWE
jgi:hypothetical protein